MNCPFCALRPTGVVKTERPLDEGMDEGEVKRRRRICRNCGRDFHTFEVHESVFRTLTATQKKLTRQPLVGRPKNKLQERRIST